jgi:hypothetical protein
MTKEAYFEMCDMMGTDPIEEEIPVEFDDFHYEVQQAFMIYRMLRDEWEGMNGIYLGKSLIGIKEILQVCEIDPQDYKIILSLIQTIDSIRQEQINTKPENKKPA